MEYLRPPNIPSMTEDEIRQFVLGVADCQIFTSAHLHDDIDQMLGMVFMPVLFGALQPEEGEDIPHKPELPDEPEEPVVDALYDKPDPPTYPEAPTPEEPSPVHIAELDFRIRWAHAPEDAVKQYKAEIEARNLKVGDEHDSLVLAVHVKEEKDIASWESECQRIEDGNSATMEHYHGAVERWKTDNKAAMAAQEEWEAMRLRWFDALAKELGVAWERMSEAGPRSVNGYPIFMSFHIMSRADWIRAEKAILAEQDRRKTIEV